MSFDVVADAYDAFMGRFSRPLAARFVAWAQVRAGQQALDVGCGPGALTAELVDRLGAGAVTAVDPMPMFAGAARIRNPGVTVLTGSAESLPFPGDRFDIALAQLVVHFMTDPIAGLHEMARVTRPGGWVAACVWDHAGASGPLSLFWSAARDLDPQVAGEGDLPGTREGHLAELAEAAGLTGVESGSIAIEVPFSSVDEWWAPFLLGVGPAGEYVASLDEHAQRALRDRCAELLPPAPFTAGATAWAVRARSA